MRASEWVFPVLEVFGKSRIINVLLFVKFFKVCEPLPSHEVVEANYVNRQTINGPTNEILSLICWNKKSAQRVLPVQTLLKFYWMMWPKRETIINHVHTEAAFLEIRDLEIEFTDCDFTSSSFYLKYFPNLNHKKSRGLKWQFSEPHVNHKMRMLSKISYKSATLN